MDDVIGKGYVVSLSVNDLHHVSREDFAVFPLLNDSDDVSGSGFEVSQSMNALHDVKNAIRSLEFIVIMPTISTFLLS